MQPNKITLYIIGGSIAALMGAYTLKAPELKAQSDYKAARTQEKTAYSESADIAADRAKHCIFVIPEKPLTDGVAAYYQKRLPGGKAIADTSRPFPVGVAVCDEWGNTGVVQRDENNRPIVSDIRTLPQEQMTDIRNQRTQPTHKTNK